MFSASTVVLISTVVFTETVDTDLMFHVNLVGNRGSAFVEPVTVIGGELFGATCLSILSPLKLNVKIECKQGMSVK